MSGDTKNARLEAYRMTSDALAELRETVENQGARETILSEVDADLSDNESEHLIRLTMREGVRGLAAYAEPPEDVECATITFVPEVWDNDYARASDDTIKFRVPRGHATDEDGNLLPDRSGDSDLLKNHRLAPLSVQHYPGPYSVLVDA